MLHASDATQATGATARIPFKFKVFCANVRAPGRFAVAEAYQRWRDATEEEILAIPLTVT